MNGRTIRATAQSPASVRGETIITFDDITDMLTAQRNSAWADIAQRIAHEIKNPLTPIQLSAERLQARYGKNGREVDDVFRQCTETIVRQVEDIGSMVDEFASFARMPSARMTHINLADTIFETLLLHRVAHNDIEYVVGDVPEINMIGDRRLIAQSLTNALKNAAEAVRSVKGEKRIELMVTLDEYEVSLSVSDTGKGWPKENRYDLLEPYKTSRDEGTGLGLSIVKKIIDDHRGRLILSDAPWCASGGTGAMLQMVFPFRPHEMVGEARVSEDL
jgi:two-component system nitrogen regulation sensor histidine kinase NtrY